MNINEKFKAINNEIKKTIAQYNLDRQIAKISSLPSGNVSKYEFLTGKDVLPKKRVFRKSYCIYSPLASELKKERFVEKQYKNLDKTFQSNKKEEDKTEENKKNRTNSNLPCNKYPTFYKYSNTKESTAKRSFGSKQNYL